MYKIGLYIVDSFDLTTQSFRENIPFGPDVGILYKLVPSK